MARSIGTRKQTSSPQNHPSSWQKTPKQNTNNKTNWRWASGARGKRPVGQLHEAPRLAGSQGARGHLIDLSHRLRQLHLSHQCPPRSQVLLSKSQEQSKPTRHHESVSGNSSPQNHHLLDTKEPSAVLQLKCSVDGIPPQSPA